MRSATRTNATMESALQYLNVLLSCGGKRGNMITPIPCQAFVRIVAYALGLAL
jgi:hypothetical protein